MRSENACKTNEKPIFFQKNDVGEVVFSFFYRLAFVFKPPVSSLRFWWISWTPKTSILKKKKILILIGFTSIFASQGKSILIVYLQLHDSGHICFKLIFRARKLKNVIFFMSIKAPKKPPDRIPQLSSDRLKMLVKQMKNLIFY